jgi:hypothetical protein
MALGTVTPRKAMGSTWANKKMRVVDVQLTSGANYTTGGETLNASACGLSRIEQANVLGLALPSGGATSRTVGVIYSNTTGPSSSIKLVVHTTASAEAAGSSDQSTFTVRLQVIGY